MCILRFTFYSHFGIVLLMNESDLFELSNKWKRIFNASKKARPAVINAPTTGASNTSISNAQSPTIGNASYDAIKMMSQKEVDTIMDALKKEKETFHISVDNKINKALYPNSTLANEIDLPLFIGSEKDPKKNPALSYVIDERLRYINKAIKDQLHPKHISNKIGFVAMEGLWAYKNSKSIDSSSSSKSVDNTSTGPVILDFIVSWSVGAVDKNNNTWPRSHRIVAELLGFYYYDDADRIDNKISGLCTTPIFIRLRVMNALTSINKKINEPETNKSVVDDTRQSLVDHGYFYVSGNIEVNDMNHLSAFEVDSLNYMMYDCDPIKII